ncbi:hypothetical protein AA313_de0200267 [Arthrobotrys entomopaga]|nr:hypothetical protein AA313_de0200267 [Arthrobotrys entomopaga]
MSEKRPTRSKRVPAKYANTATAAAVAATSAAASDGDDDDSDVEEAQAEKNVTKTTTAKQTSKPAKAAAAKKKLSKAGAESAERIQSIKWTEEREKMLASMMSHEYNKYLVGNKSEYCRRWAKGLGVTANNDKELEAQGKRVSTQVRAMINKWNEVYKFENRTGNGDIEGEDGTTIVTLREQCLQRCSYYEILYPILSTKQTGSMSSQLTPTGVSGQNQKPVDELEQVDEEEENDDDVQEKPGPSMFKRAATSRAERPERPGYESDMDFEDQETAGIASKSKSRKESAAPGLSTPSTVPPSRKEKALSKKQGDFGLQELVVLPAAARKAKYEARLAAQKTEQSKLDAEHAIKEMEILEKDRHRRHEIKLHNANQETEYYKSEMERIGLLIAANIPLSEADKNFLTRPRPQPKPLKVNEPLPFKAKSAKAMLLQSLETDDEELPEDDDDDDDDDVFKNKAGKAAGKPFGFKIKPGAPSITTPSARAREAESGTPSTSSLSKRPSAAAHPDERPRKNSRLKRMSVKDVAPILIPDDDDINENDEDEDEDEEEEEVVEKPSRGKWVGGFLLGDETAPNYYQERPDIPLPRDDPAEMARLEARERHARETGGKPIMHDIGPIHKSQKIPDRYPVPGAKQLDILYQSLQKIQNANAPAVPVIKNYRARALASELGLPYHTSSNNLENKPNQQGLPTSTQPSEEPSDMGSNLSTQTLARAPSENLPTWVQEYTPPAPQEYTPPTQSFSQLSTTNTQQLVEVPSHLLEEFLRYRSQLSPSTQEASQPMNEIQMQGLGGPFHLTKDPSGAKPLLDPRLHRQE